MGMLNGRMMPRYILARFCFAWTRRDIVISNPSLPVITLTHYMPRPSNLSLNYRRYSGSGSMIKKVGRSMTSPSINYCWLFARSSTTMALSSLSSIIMSSDVARSIGISISLASTSSAGFSTSRFYNFLSVTSLGGALRFLTPDGEYTSGSEKR